MPRQFRNADSLEAERQTRDGVKPLLESRGFQVSDFRQMHGAVQSQILTLKLASGVSAKARVKICWRREDRRSDGARYAASQLMFKAEGKDWVRALEGLVRKEREAGITHLLFVQREGDIFSHAALVPADQIPAIWQSQRETFQRLIENGEAGRRTSNPSENGDSPTLYLQDDRTPKTPDVARVLWTWPGVENLLAVAVHDGENWNDTFDDMPPGLELGRDEGKRRQTLRSGVRRDPRVRRAVLERANGQCERPGCSEARPFSAFLDVHHILGVHSSDRFWSCVAICPNCHREAHFSPQSDALNEQLRSFASQFAPAR